jgi:hypothetical protein
MARWPKYIPTDEQRRQVLSLTGLGITYVEIAKLFNIGITTLRKHYRYELDTGATVANAKVAQSLFENATKHNNAMAQIWWTKARMGWREARDLNVGGQQDNPVAVEFTWAPALSPPVQVAAPHPEGEEIEGESEELEVSWGEVPDAC